VSVLTLAMLPVFGCSEEDSEDFVDTVKPLTPVLDYVLDRWYVAGNTINLFPMGG
jgi:hypothetical protein